MSRPEMEIAEIVFKVMKLSRERKEAVGRLSPGTAVIRGWPKDPKAWESMKETEKELLRGGGETGQDGVKTEKLSEEEMTDGADAAGSLSKRNA